MDDEEILARGGDEEDIRKYAEENGATNPMSKLDELDKEFDKHWLEANALAGLEERHENIKSFARKYYELGKQEAYEVYWEGIKVMESEADRGIKKARLEEREVIKKMIEGKKKTPSIFDSSDVYLNREQEIYNQALSDLLSELNK